MASDMSKWWQTQWFQSIESEVVTKPVLATPKGSVPRYPSELGMTTKELIDERFRQAMALMNQGEIDLALWQLESAVELLKWW